MDELSSTRDEAHSGRSIERGGTKGAPGDSLFTRGKMARKTLRNVVLLLLAGVVVWKASDKTDLNDFNAIKISRLVAPSEAPPEAVEECGYSARINRFNKVKSNTEFNASEFERFEYVHIFKMVKYNVVGCLPPKGGCSTWKVIIANNTEEEALPDDFEHWKLHQDGDSEKYFTRLSQAEAVERKKLLDDNFKFMVTRHPMDRLESAYKDKLHNTGDLEFKYNLIEKIFTRLYGAAGFEERKGKDVTFKEFIKYLLLGAQDAHWKPIHLLCHVDEVNYDQILKLESHPEDSLHMVTHHLGGKNRSLDFHANKAREGASGERVLNLFSELSVDEIENVLKLGFGKDMELFGYSWYLNDIGKVISHCGTKPGEVQCC